MAKTQTVQDISRQLQERRQQLVQEMQALQDTLEQLEHTQRELQEVDRMLGVAEEGRAHPRRRSRSAPSRSRRGSRYDAPLLALCAQRPRQPRELARELGMHPTYVYKVLRDLQQGGRLRHAAEGYVSVEPVVSDSAPEASEAEALAEAPPE